MGGKTELDPELEMEHSSLIMMGIRVLSQRVEMCWLI